MRKMLISCRLAIITFALMVLIPAICGAKEVKLTYGNFFPPTHIQSLLAESWCKEVAKQTAGRVTIQYFPGQTLMKAKQTYEGVVNGVADIGFSVFAYTRGRFPVIGAVDLPFGYPSGKVATALINDVYTKFNPKELNDTKIMYMHAHGPGIIHTKGKPVTKLEDMKGLKIRSTGISALMVKALGGTPVAMGMPDAYQSLQKGIVDGSAHPAESNKGWKLGEVVDHAVYAYGVAYTTSFFVTMNKDKWALIDAKDQKIIEGINKTWAAKHGAAWDSSDMAGIRFFMQQGSVASGLDSEESTRWQKAVAPVIDDYRKKLDSKGLDGKAIIEFIRESLKKNTA